MIQLSENINTLGSTFSSVDSNIYNRFESTNDKDVFEKVIDDLIIERYTKDPEMKEYIKSLPKNNKRVAILSLIGEDNLLWSKINDILKEKKTGYQRLKEVYFLLRGYVKIADVERKKHGEILTPFKELAEPMVKLVEKYDSEFWKNPNHKVLDSSAGYGTFLILSAYKFMVGLRDWEPDEEKRFKWIIENCLYYGELQARSVFSWLVAIDPYDEYKTNTYYGSFLIDDFDNHARNVWGIEKWDLIIQNPPYQMRKEGFKKTQPLWHLFVQKSLTLLNKDGYMVMVHPAGWRNIDGDYKSTQSKIKQNQILYLSINDVKSGERIFGASTRYDYYILKNCNPNNKTIVISQSHKIYKIDISNLEFIPNDDFNEVFKLISKNEERVNILYSRSLYGSDNGFMSKNKNEIYKYDCLMNVNVKNVPSSVWYSKRDVGHFGIPKVIFGRKTCGVLVDIDGSYGTCQDCCSIVDDVVNLQNIQKAMLNKEFINLMKSCDVGGVNDRYSRKIIASFRKDFWKEFIN